jgi:hypothetical protein
VGKRGEVLARSIRGPAVSGGDVARGEAVDLAQHQLHVWLLLRALRSVVPDKVEDRPILPRRCAGVQLFEPVAKIDDEGGVGTGVAGRFDRAPMPLDEPHRVGQ